MRQLRIQRLANRLAALSIAASLLAATPFATAAVHPIVLEGENPFSTGEDAFFVDFSTPSLNNRGQVAFAANLQGGDVGAANNTGYWIASHESLDAAAREGSPAPDMPAGTVFGNVSFVTSTTLSLSDAGEIALGRAVTLPNSTTSSGVWIGNGQTLTMLAAQGAAAPTAENGATYLDLSQARASINRRGDVAFSTNLNSEPYNSINSFNSNDGVLVLNRSGPVATSLAGTTATALGPNAKLVGYRTATFPALNRFGEAAFVVTHKLDPSSSTTGNSIWKLTASGAELRGATGQPLPEFGPNATFNFLSQPGINAGGTLVAEGNFTGSNGSPANGSAIVISDATGQSLPAHAGAVAPGTGGHTYQQTFYDPAIGSGGHIAFFGTEWDGSTNQSGIWAGRPDDLHLVARQNDPAPGTNATFNGFIRNTPAINRFGQVAFSVFLTTTPGSNTDSLWATDLDGDLTLIARVGNTIEIAAGDVRTVSFLAMLTNHGDDDGRPRGMNDLGQVAFRAGFSDGSSGIFLSDSVTHLPGDYNGDGTVDAGDYVVWRKAVATQNPIADGDRNGIVDGADHELMKDFFGISLISAGGGGAAMSIPEPHTGVLLVVAGASLIGWRRRDRR